MTRRHITRVDYGGISTGGISTNGEDTHVYHCPDCGQWEHVPVGDPDPARTADDQHECADDEDDEDEERS